MYNRSLPLRAAIMNERCALSHTHPELSLLPQTAVWDESPAMRGRGFRSHVDGEVISSVLHVCAHSSTLAHTQMFWNRSDNNTIFRRGCPHMGEFTAGGLCVCACNDGGVWARSWQTSSSIQVVRLRAWKAKKGKGGESCGKLNRDLNIRGDHSHLQCTSHRHTHSTSALAPAHPEKRLVVIYSNSVSRLMNGWQRLCVCGSSVIQYRQRGDSSVGGRQSVN